MLPPKMPESAREITVAVVDDHEVVHAGIAAWCANAEPPVRFVGNYPNPTAFVAHQAHIAAPADVVLFDLQFNARRPDFTTLAQICQTGHRVVVYSHMATDEIILTSLDAGAITYLVKSEGRRHLLDAIHAADSATPYVAPRMAKAMYNDANIGRPSLSDREKEVLIAWFQTESKDHVGKKLHIEPNTVRTHLQRIRAKYAAVGRPAPSKAALVARAVQDGLLSTDEM